MQIAISRQAELPGRGGRALSRGARVAWGSVPCAGRVGTVRPRCVCSAAGTRRNLRNDLLVAADSITNTMSSLVKELHSGRSYLAACTRSRKRGARSHKLICLQIYCL